MTRLEKLCHDLREAVQVFAEDERAGAGKSLAAVNDYLDDIGVPARHPWLSTSILFMKLPAIVEKCVFA